MEVTSDAADLLQRDAAGGELGRVHLDADRRRAVAEDRDLGNAGHLRDLLGEEEIGVVVDEGQRIVSERTENMMIGESAGLTFL